MINDKKIDSGDNSTNSIGDNNTFNIQQYVSAEAIQPVNTSYLYQICKDIIEADIRPSEEYPLKLNAEWTKKLEFNNVSQQYIELLNNDLYAHDQVADIMKTFPSQDVLVRKVNHIFLDAEKRRIANNEDGDFVLNEVHKELDKILDRSNEEEKKIPIEEKDRCIWLVMFYVFTKCQLLRKPEPSVN